jgi:hypothetical protein
MSIETPAALAADLVESDADVASKSGAWIETAVAVIFTVTAVLCVSFVAVVSGLV